MGRNSVLLALALYIGPAAAWESVTSTLVVRCRQPALATLECDYRAAAGGDTALTLATDAGIVTPGEQQAYPWRGAGTALLLLVDTSDPGRAGVVQANIGQVASLARAVRPHQRIGLARFDRELELLAPVGSGADVVAAAAGRLQAGGMTTELYRHVLRAVELLAATEAERRFVVVFSDGQAEDTAYFHDDVVTAARAAGVGILGLGFPRSQARSVALQSLRRLSEETGSLYLESDLAGNLPPGFEQTVLGSVEHGARVVFTLPVGAGSAVSLLVRHGGGQTRHEVPIRVQAGVATAPVPAATARARAEPAPAPTTRADPKAGALLWYGIPAALLVLILLALVTLIMLYRQPRQTAAAGQGPALPRPFAYLISQSSHPRRFAIASPIWRIGRSRENEMVLDDISISRRHAEIQRGPDGAFTLLDRGSRNGIYVNGQQVRKHVLKENDMIEIGDVALRFTEVGVDEQLQEQTAMQHTRQPRIS